MWPDLGRLFFIEGALTIFVALIAVFILPDFPSTSHRWLSPIEVKLAVKRMEEDAGIGDEGRTEAKGQVQILFEALTDWKVMYMALKCVTLRFLRLPPTHLGAKHYLHRRLPLFQRVLPYSHCYSWVQPNCDPPPLRATLGVCNSGRVRSHKVDFPLSILGEALDLCGASDTQTLRGRDHST
jgi:hypothetical protein